jgi:SAM-dependent methyltransferase
MTKDWDTYWTKEQTFFGKTLTFVRKNVITSELSRTLKKYFPKEGLFLDAGSGSSETSLKIKNRKIIALDLSHLVLKKVNPSLPIDSKINASIFQLPFKNNSLDGIFNLGVMEHFHKEDIIKILNEFYRTLKKDSYCILFWPSVYGPTNLIFSTLGFILRKQFFPDEVSQYRNKKWLKNILKESNFKLIKIRWPLKGGLIYHEIILKKV